MKNDTEKLKIACEYLLKEWSENRLSRPMGDDLVDILQEIKIPKGTTFPLTISFTKEQLNRKAREYVMEAYGDHFSEMKCKVLGFMLEFTERLFK